MSEHSGMILGYSALVNCLEESHCYILDKGMVIVEEKNGVGSLLGAP